MSTTMSDKSSSSPTNPRCSQRLSSPSSESKRRTRITKVSSLLDHPTFSPAGTHPPVIVFSPTARAAALFHDVFNSIGAFPVWEIHSRLSQAKRTKTTEQFRAAKRGVLFSSDVTARGIDIKDITAVLQVGLPANSEQCE
jgi:superfamily II DNA/RNA helicase